MASSPALYRAQGSWAACKARLLVQREKFCRMERIASLSSSMRTAGSGKSDSASSRILASSSEVNLRNLAATGSMLWTGFWPVWMEVQWVTNSCMTGSVFSASWESSRCSLSARRQGCNFCLRSCMACSLFSAKRRFSACTVKAGCWREGLGKSLPGFQHADEIALQPRIGLARASRVVAQLQKQTECLVEAFCLLLKSREFRSSFLLLGFFLNRLYLRQDRRRTSWRGGPAWARRISAGCHPRPRSGTSRISVRSVSSSASRKGTSSHFSGSTVQA